MNYFYKFSTVAAMGNAMNVTVTPSADSGNTEMMQIMAYSGAISYDPAISGYSAQTTSSTTWTQSSGTPGGVGNLLIYFICFNTDTGTHTVTPTAGVNTVRLTPLGTSGGGMNGGGCGMMVMDNVNYTSATAATCTATIGTADTGGKWVIGFRAGSALTRTQTARARIVNTRTVTQTARGRIANRRTLTQPARGRISNSRNTTQPSRARIATSFTRSQPAKAFIISGLQRTQIATARIVRSLVKTQSANARISNYIERTQTAQARIAKSFANNQPAKAVIGQTGTKSQPAKGYVAQTAERTQPAKAAIIFRVSTVQTARARLSRSRLRTQRARARIIQNTYIFTPPATDGPSRYTGRNRERLWRHYRRQLTGTSVLKINGEYIELETPTRQQIEDAEIAYIGGHEHIVSSDEADALMAAGYSITSGVTQ